jgi:hypothetical protein
LLDHISPIMSAVCGDPEDLPDRAIAYAESDANLFAYWS